MKKKLLFLIMTVIIAAFTHNVHAELINTEFESDIHENLNLDIHMDGDSVYANDLVSIGGNLDVKGTVEGDVVGIGALVYIDGHITGDLVLIGSTGQIDSNTVVDGEFVTIGALVDIHENAKLTGPVTNINVGPFQKLLSLRFRPSQMEKQFSIGLLISSIAKFLAIFLLGCLVLLLFTKFNRVEKTLGLNPLRSFLFGILAEILIIPAVIVLAISLIGIPFIPVFFLITGIGVFIGSIIIIHMLGSFVLKEFKAAPKHFVINLLIGLSVLSVFPLLSKIGIWAGIEWISTLFGIISFIQWYIVITYAFGIMTLSKFGTRIYIPDRNEEKMPHE